MFQPEDPATFGSKIYNLVASTLARERTATLPTQTEAEILEHVKPQSATA